MPVAVAYPGTGEMVVGVNNHWNSDDEWAFRLYGSHAFADFSVFRGEGLLVGAKLVFNRARAATASSEGCDPLPLVRILDAPWDENPETLMQLPASPADRNNLVQTISRWMMRPAENRGFRVDPGIHTNPLPWNFTKYCSCYYNDVHLELEFLDSAE